MKKEKLLDNVIHTYGFEHEITIFMFKLAENVDDIPTLLHVYDNAIRAYENEFDD